MYISSAWGVRLPRFLWTSRVLHAEPESHLRLTALPMKIESTAMKLRMFLRVVYSVRTVLAFASTLFLVISIKAEAQAQTDDDRAIAGAMDATNEFMQTFNNKNSVA